MRNIFEHMGKVPTAIWFDNMSTAVKTIRKNGERDLSKGFERFMLHYGFMSNFCNPNSGHEKGHVENKVGYHRRNFLVPVPEFKDISEYNTKLLKKCDSDMNRKHYMKLEYIDTLYEEDKASMGSLPEVPFDVYRLELVKADKYAKVRYENRLYSSSPEYAGRDLWIKAGAITIEVMNQKYETIVTHPRLYGEQRESMIWTPYLKLMAKRPTALKYTGFFKELPTALQDYFAKCDFDEKKNSLNTLARMINDTDMQTAAKAFEESLKRNLIDSDSVLAIYNRITSRVENIRFLNLPEVKPYTPDTKAYDILLNGGMERWKQ